MLAYFLGAWLCVVGVLQLASGLASIKSRWPHALMGIVTLGAGIATLVWPHITLYVIALDPRLDPAAVGHHRHRRRLSHAGRVPHWWLGIVKGVILFALGIWAIRHPGNALTVLVVVFGITCVFWGALELIAAFFAHHARKNLQRARDAA